MAEASVPPTRGAPAIVPEVPTIARSRATQVGLFDRLWRLLSSVRFAMLLITIAAVGVLAGTLIMQAPTDVRANPDSYTAWLARPAGKYGQPWADIFAALDLYRVFASLWFRGTLAILSLAVVICTVNRMPGIIASIRRPAVKVPERLFERAPLRAEFRFPGVSAERAQVQVTKVLGAYRYRLIPWRDGSANVVFSDRNRFGKAGTFLNHLGIITILGAAVLGNVLGWRENGFMVPEGSMRPVGHETGLVVRNDGFTDEYFPSGTPKDYRSDLVLLQNGKEVAHKTIRVNDPLDWGGVRFHQAFFGPAAVMRATDSQGNVVFEDGVALGYEFDGTGLARNGGFFTLGNRNGLPTLAVYVLVPAAQRGVDPAIPAGSVRLEIFEPRQARPTVIDTLAQGAPKDILGYTFEFLRERQFSGLQVVYNPAVPVIWIACAMMLVGMLTVFNFPLRRVWARLDPLEEEERRKMKDESADPADDSSSVRSLPRVPSPPGCLPAPPVRAGGRVRGLGLSGAKGPSSPSGVRVRLAAVSNRDVLFAREFERLALAIDEQIRGLAIEPAAPGRVEVQSTGDDERAQPAEHTGDSTATVEAADATTPVEA
jgi:cytochrome c biogenesis protein